MAMGAPENFTGRRFGRLTALYLSWRDYSGLRQWMWRCDCGKEIERPSAPIKAGRQVSCGCHKNEQSRLRARHGRSTTRTYRAWIEMKARCRGKDEVSRKNYLGRGIKVAPRWNKFEAFFSDMGECPPKMTLERIDNDGDYRPENCRWAFQRDQLRNTRRTIKVLVDGKEMCLKDACISVGANYDAVRSRIRLGAHPQAALGRNSVDHEVIE